MCAYDQLVYDVMPTNPAFDWLLKYRMQKRSLFYGILFCKRKNGCVGAKKMEDYVFYA